MKAHQFISALDEARYGGRRVAEDTAPVAKAPSHAPTSSAGYTTPSSGKSKDEGERMGGSKDAIKKSDSAIPAPVAKAPSHAPTSSAGYETKGEGKSSDEGEKISKEAMKENLVNLLLNDDDADIEAMMAEAELSEGGHKAGCKCGFCMNKGKFGKKSDDDGEKKDEGDDKEGMEEAMPIRPPMGRPTPGTMRRPGQRPGGPGQRMGFKHPSATSPRPKAAMAPYQPSMENRERSKNSGRGISEMADRLLAAPDSE